MLGSRPVSEQLLRQLGIRAISLDERLQRKLGLTDQHGLVILALSPHHPASLSLEPLDVIVSIDGRPVATVADADRVLSAATDGDVTLEVLRPGQAVTRRTVTLGR